MTPSQFKSKYLLHNPDGQFFGDTTKFVGDTMKSYACCFFGDKYVLYRKPEATVNCFGTFKKVYSDHNNFYSAWYLDENNNLQILSNEDKLVLYGLA